VEAGTFTCGHAIDRRAAVGRLSSTVPSQPQPQQSSLYRRHRPRTFTDVVGQEAVVRTLRNAVTRDQVHHAYLFVGSRGTGKTSMAKILAACLNCDRDPTHPTIEPCGECDSCTAIARASSLDVIEMDAASNNSVEDIRDLRESVAFAPVSGRRKVYILDEAHMLSTAAWNAFLKTLEEPPPGTVFVLATTEAAKVPATVVDRCHRFDFQRPSVEDISHVLRRTAQAESIEIGPEAIAALARSATGSFRDALGTLEQLLAYSGPQIELADVLAVLGIADSALLERAVDAIAAADARGALLALAECADCGRDAASFASDLETRARELLVVQTLGEVPAELALTPESDARLAAQAERVPHATVVRLLELIGSALESVRAGTDARTSLELALVKAARPEVDASTSALLARIERLEGGRQVPAATPVVVSPPAAPVDEAPAPIEEGVSVPVEDPAPAPVDEVSTAPIEEPLAPIQDTVDPVVEPLEDLDAVIELWPAVIELVGAGHALCGAVIADTRPIELEGEELTVGFPTSAAFLKKKAEDPSNRQIVTDALRQLAGGRWRITYELHADLDADAGQGTSRPLTEEEWIERFKSELDAEEIEIEPTSGGAAVEAGAGAVAGEPVSAGAERRGA
jgi:DNA polymerase III subunit gamma/tau